MLHNRIQKQIFYILTIYKADNTTKATLDFEDYFASIIAEQLHDTTTAKSQTITTMKKSDQHISSTLLIDTSAKNSLKETTIDFADFFATATADPFQDTTTPKSQTEKTTQIPDKHMANPLSNSTFAVNSKTKAKHNLKKHFATATAEQVQDMAAAISQTKTTTQKSDQHINYTLPNNTSAKNSKRDTTADFMDLFATATADPFQETTTAKSQTKTTTPDQHIKYSDSISTLVSSFQFPVSRTRNSFLPKLFNKPASVKVI